MGVDISGTNAPATSLPLPKTTLTPTNAPSNSWSKITFGSTAASYTTTNATVNFTLNGVTKSVNVHFLGFQNDDIPSMVLRILNAANADPSAAGIIFDTSFNPESISPVSDIWYYGYSQNSKIRTGGKTQRWMDTSSGNRMIATAIPEDKWLTEIQLSYDRDKAGFMAAVAEMIGHELRHGAKENASHSFDAPYSSIPHGSAAQIVDYFGKQGHTLYFRPVQLAKFSRLT